MATEIESPVSDVAGKIKNRKLLKWVEEAAAMCKPDRVHLCDGSDQEYELMTRLMLQSGTAISLNPQKRPNSICRSEKLWSIRKPHWSSSFAVLWAATKFGKPLRFGSG